jgi:uncharacterized membrane protein YjjP (DUF1212 family)
MPVDKYVFTPKLNHHASSLRDACGKLQQIQKKTHHYSKKLRQHLPNAEIR